MDRNRANGTDAVDVSVIIPCYNAQAVLAACLESIHNHPPTRSCEVIVVNDASTDGTPDMVRARFRWEAGLAGRHACWRFKVAVPLVRRSNAEVQSLQRDDRMNSPRGKSCAAGRTPTST